MSEDGPQEVTMERIEAAIDSLKHAFSPSGHWDQLQGDRACDDLKKLLADMDYYTHWVQQQTERNRDAIRKILEHVDLHGDAPPAL